MAKGVATVQFRSVLRRIEVHVGCLAELLLFGNDAWCVLDVFRGNPDVADGPGADVVGLHMNVA